MEAIYTPGLGLRTEQGSGCCPDRLKKRAVSVILQIAGRLPFAVGKKDTAVVTVLKEFEILAARKRSYLHLIAVKVCQEVVYFCLAKFHLYYPCKHPKRN